MASAPDLAPIQKQIVDATREMFDRALSAVPEGAEVTDELLTIADSKSEIETDPRLAASGPLQDCEFGMILVLARDWCSGGGGEKDFFNSARFEQVVCVLVKRVVDRVFQVDKNLARGDKGGEGKKKQDGRPTAFFTAEPYTKYTDQKVRFPYYSANLDAAMITIAFLAPAISQYNERLVGYDYKPPGLPDWVHNLRDAALYVILDGLHYALDCQIIANRKCQGFTCDPNTRDKFPEDGGFGPNSGRENDRLFFTWTACETIRDVAEWRDSYLKNLPPTPPPKAAVDELTPLIQQLEESLLQSANWCKSNFYKDFENFEVPDTAHLVKLGWSAETEDQINQMERDVLHVYHLSQYAAIRSLAPEGVTLEEVRTVSDKLDSLVTDAIMDSDLDAADDPALFRTLTRKYWLGTSNPGFYIDDAWYPLVVRSLSGLLSRTLSGIGRKYSRTDVDDLTKAFEDNLKNHVDNLLERRPEGGSDGPDGKLWSFAINQPYVLYATQRTVFALMTYGDFLTEVARFRTDLAYSINPIGSVVPGSLRQELSLRAARKLADTILDPIIDELLQVARVSAGVAPAAAGNGSGVLLPDEPWAAGTIRDVVGLFTTEFEEQRFAERLRQRANILIYFRETIAKHPLPEPLPNPLPSNYSKPLVACHKVWEEIRNVDHIGQQLETSGWTLEAVTRILFEHLFREYVSLPEGSLDAVLNREKPDNLWKLIDRAQKNQDSYNKQ